MKKALLLLISFLLFSCEGFVFTGPEEVIKEPDLRSVVDDDSWVVWLTASGWRADRSHVMESHLGITVEFSESSDIMTAWTAVDNSNRAFFKIKILKDTLYLKTEDETQYLPCAQLERYEKEGIRYLNWQFLEGETSFNRFVSLENTILFKEVDLLDESEPLGETMEDGDLLKALTGSKWKTDELKFREKDTLVEPETPESSSADTWYITEIINDFLEAEEALGELDPDVFLFDADNSREILMDTLLSEGFSAEVIESVSTVMPDPDIFLSDIDNTQDILIETLISKGYSVEVIEAVSTVMDGLNGGDYENPDELNYSYAEPDYYKLKDIRSELYSEGASWYDATEMATMQLVFQWYEDKNYMSMGEAVNGGEFVLRDEVLKAEGNKLYVMNRLRTSWDLRWEAVMLSEDVLQLKEYQYGTEVALLSLRRVESFLPAGAGPVSLAFSRRNGVK